jgi:predicted protein tyrosine phosphatase
MVTDLMPITGTTDNDIVLIIGIIVKDQLAKDTIIIVMQKNHRRSDNRRYTKTVGIQMTTDMPKSKENMQTKETIKIIMENINSNYETKKESALRSLF